MAEYTGSRHRPISGKGGSFLGDRSFGGGDKLIRVVVLGGWAIIRNSPRL